MHQGAISLCMLDLPSCFRQLSHQTLLIEFWGNRIKRPYFYRECDGACTSYHLSHYYLILHSHPSCLYVLAYQNIWWYNVQAKYLCALCMNIFELNEPHTCITHGISPVAIYILLTPSSSTVAGSRFRRHFTVVITCLSQCLVSSVL